MIGESYQVVKLLNHGIVKCRLGQGRGVCRVKKLTKERIILFYEALELYIAKYFYVFPWRSYVLLH